MDSNVTGRHRDLVGDFNESPHVRRIFVRDLSPASDGNGNGIGLADVTTRRLVEKLDLKTTYVNSIAAISPEKAAIPMYMDSDHDAIAACLRTSGRLPTDAARLVRIRNTKALELLQVSSALKEEVEAAPDLVQVTPFSPIRYDENGNLFPLS